VKAKLAQFDRSGLIGLLGDLHCLSRDNQAFLNSRLGAGADQLAPYKQSIARWVSPDLSRNQDISITKAKKAIADYRKAEGTPEDIAELSMFYCVQAARLALDYSLEDEGYILALVRMFDNALAAVMGLEPSQQLQLLERLRTVRSTAQAIGWAVKDAMDDACVHHADSH
jgi:hypothetical protein